MKVRLCCLYYLGPALEKEACYSQDCKLIEGQLKIFYNIGFKTILFNKKSGDGVFLGLIQQLVSVATTQVLSVFPCHHPWLLLAWCLALSPTGYKVAATVQVSHEDMTMSESKIGEVGIFPLILCM